MRGKCILFAFALSAVCCAFSDEQYGRWPLVVIRHTGEINGKPEVFRQLIDEHRRYPGACDEFWFCAPGRKQGAELERDCRAFARYRSLCDEVGIRMSFQQGVTLGHGEDPETPAPGDWALSESSWQVMLDGRRMRFPCPRSPEVQALEKAYVKTVLAVAAPDSIWLDDDLRLGICKPDGCFCERCLEAFSRRVGRSWSREELVAHLYSSEDREPIRAQWIAFNAESLGLFAAAARAAVDEAGAACRLGYQAVWADTIYTGRDMMPLLEGLSGPKNRLVGIRPGALNYTEEHPREMVRKCLGVSREAERCRTWGRIGTVCYEQETYPRHLLHKSPGAIVVESALAFASGCDTVSEYWYAAECPEPISEYGRFLKALKDARPYFKCLSQSVRRTRLGGVARYVGSRAGEVKGFDLRDEADFWLACAGIPVTVAESGTRCWYLTAKSVREMDDRDWKMVSVTGALVPASVRKAMKPSQVTAFGKRLRSVADFEQYPLVYRRNELLDALDEQTGGLCVRLDESRCVRILPRVREDGTVDSVTLLNLSIGDTGEMHIRIRRSCGADVVWMGPEGIDRDGRIAGVESGTKADEIVVRLSNMKGWQIGTLFFGNRKRQRVDGI